MQSDLGLWAINGSWCYGLDYLIVMMLIIVIIINEEVEFVVLKGISWGRNSREA